MKKEQRLNPDIFAKESIWKLMVKMCLPAVITILIMVIYNMADHLLYRTVKGPLQGHRAFPLHADHHTLICTGQ